MLRAYTLMQYELSPPSLRNAAMRLPQPRLGQCNSAGSKQPVKRPHSNSQSGTMAEGLYFVLLLRPYVDGAYFQD